MNKNHRFRYKLIDIIDIKIVLIATTNGPRASIDKPKPWQQPIRGRVPSGGQFIIQLV